MATHTMGASEASERIFAGTAPDNLLVTEELSLSDEALRSLPENLRIEGDLGICGCPLLVSLPRGLVVRGSLYIVDCNALEALPLDLEVTGGIHLTDCAALTSLPSGLKCHHLFIRGCPALTAIPHGLVTDELDVKGCTALTSIPADIRVKGIILLQDCTALESFPPGFRHEASLQLYGCTALRSLPAGMVVGYAWFDQLPQLESLPEGFAAETLDLLGCPLLTTLPDSLKVGSNIGLKNCPSLRSIPEGARFGGVDSPAFIDIEDCPALEAIPDALSRTASIRLYRCASLKTLPEGLTHASHSFQHAHFEDCPALESLPEGFFQIDCDLTLKGCTSLKKLPEGLTVKGTLTLHDCPALTALPQGLSQEAIDLRRCTGLASLPRGWSVPSSLDLRDCASLKALPEGLIVHGSLDLRGLAQLTSLPRGLRVGKDLLLAGATGLGCLPDELLVGRNLDLSGLTQLTSLPGSLQVGGVIVDEGCAGLEPFWRALDEPRKSLLRRRPGQAFEAALARVANEIIAECQQNSRTAAEHGSSLRGYTKFFEGQIDAELKRAARVEAFWDKGRALLRDWLNGARECRLPRGWGRPSKLPSIELGSGVVTEVNRLMNLTWIRSFSIERAGGETRSKCVLSIGEWNSTLDWYCRDPDEGEEPYGACYIDGTNRSWSDIGACAAQVPTPLSPQVFYVYVYLIAFNIDEKTGGHPLSTRPTHTSFSLDESEIELPRDPHGRVTQPTRARSARGPGKAAAAGLAGREGSQGRGARGSAGPSSARSAGGLARGKILLGGSLRTLAPAGGPLRGLRCLRACAAWPLRAVVLRPRPARSLRQRWPRGPCGGAARGERVERLDALRGSACCVAPRLPLGLGIRGAPAHQARGRAGHGAYRGLQRRGCAGALRGRRHRPPTHGRQGI